MIAYCGLNCEKCEGYLATREANDALRVEVAEKWSKEHNADISPDQINCTGCKSDGLKFFFTETMCPTRKCNIEKSTAYCAECDQYQCDTLKQFVAVAPQIRDALELLRQKL